MSLSALLGKGAIGSEVSYRPKDPILVDPFSCADLGGGGADCAGNWATYRDAHKLQWNTTWWRAVNPSDGDWYAAGVRALGALIPTPASGPPASRSVAPSMMLSTSGAVECVAGSRIRSHERRTSVASSGLPSLKLRPDLRRNV